MESLWGLKQRDHILELVTNLKHVQVLDSASDYGKNGWTL